MLKQSRLFSTALSTNNAATAATQYQVQTLWEFSEKKLAERNAKTDAEANYLNDLNKCSHESGFFKKLEASPSDNYTIKKIKSKINHIVAQELARHEFKEKVNTEALVSSTTDEVITHSSFYFNVDEHKKSKNIKVHNLRAPGNKYHKPQYILPHEHINVQNYINTSDLTQEKLFEIYGYYAFLVDMHIAQVRPENLDEKSYVPARFNQENPTFFKPDEHLDNRFFDFYHRMREPTRKWFSQT